MDLKYRIKKYEFPCSETLYVAQYRILGIWMSITKNQLGRFLKPSSTYCETLVEARNRIELHKKNMKRAGDWLYRSATIIDIE